MLKKILSMLIIWCALLFSGTLLIYLFHGENLQLLKIDIIYLREYRQNAFWKEIIFYIIVITVFLMCSILKKRARIITFVITMKNSEKRKYLRLCWLKPFKEHTVWLAFLATLVAFIIGGYGITDLKNIEKKNTYLPTKSIIHAMGQIEDNVYTNSLEAFQLHYANGQRFFEVDFSMTADGMLVARHDWGSWWQTGIDEDHVPTENDFLKIPIFGKYTPLTLKDIIHIMQQYDNIYIVTDTKNEVPELAKRDISILVDTAKEMGAEDVLDRFIIQVYSVRMYEAIKEIYEFPNYILTLYMIWTGDVDEFVEYCRFCKKNGIRTITMRDHRYTENFKIRQVAEKYGIAIFVHTVNDRETAEEVFSLGVNGIYTDNEIIME